MNDLRAAPRGSDLRWWEMILALGVLAGPPSFRRRDPLASLRGEIDLAVGIEIAVWLLAAAWAVWMCLRLRDGERIEARLPALPWPVLGGVALGAALILVGLAWSPSPALSVFRGYQLGLAAVLAYLLVRRLGREASASYLRRGLAILCYSVLVVWIVAPDLVVPDYQHFGLRGDVVAPASYIGLLLFVFTLADRALLRDRSNGAVGERTSRSLVRRLGAFLLDSKYVLVPLALSLVVLARRRLGLALLAASVIFLVVRLGERRSAPARLTLGATLVLGILAAGFGSLMILEWWVRSPEEIGTLGQRIPLWNHLLDYLSPRGWVLGVGFVAVSRVLGPQAHEDLADAHNSFLEILLGAGLLGMTFYLAVWIFVLYRAVSALLRGGRMEAAIGWSALCLFAVAQITSHLVLPTPLSFSFWTVVALTSVPRR